MRDATRDTEPELVADGSETPSGKIGPIGISHQSIAGRKRAGNLVGTRRLFSTI